MEPKPKESVSGKRKDVVLDDGTKETYYNGKLIRKESPNGQVQYYDLQGNTTDTFLKEAE